MMINDVEYNFVDDSNGIEVYENGDVKYYQSGNIVSKSLERLNRLKSMGMGAPIFSMCQSGEIVNCKEFSIKELL